MKHWPINKRMCCCGVRIAIHHPELIESLSAFAKYQAERYAHEDEIEMLREGR